MEMNITEPIFRIPNQECHRVSLQSDSLVPPSMLQIATRLRRVPKVPEGRDELLISHLEDLLDDKLPPAPGYSSRAVGKFATSAVAKPFTPKPETVGPHLGGKE